MPARFALMNSKFRILRNLKFTTRHFSHEPILDFSKLLYIEEQKLDDPKILNSIVRRKSVDIDLHNVKQLVRLFNDHSALKETLVKSKQNTIAELRVLRDISSTHDNHVSRHIESNVNKLLFIKKQEQIVQKYHNLLKEIALNRYTSVPNDLHENTPDKTESVIYSKSFSENMRVENHLTVGKNLGVLDYHNNSFYFLVKEAALLELAAINFFVEALQTDYGFLAFLNPDTCNNSIVDAISDRKKGNEFFQLEGNKFSLTGGSSFASFCAFRIGQSVHSKYLPERNISWGRCYKRDSRCENDGLYSVYQRSNVQIFSVSESFQQMNEEFNGILQALKILYDQLGVDYRICYLPASLLMPGERLKASIQLFSIHMNKFIEIGHLSTYGDYVSKRLRILCHDRNQVYRFVNIIEGTAFSYPVLLAYLLERSSTTQKLLIPECLKPFMYF